MAGFSAKEIAQAIEASLKTSGEVVETFQPVGNMDTFRLDDMCEALRKASGPSAKFVSGTRLTDAQFREVSGALRRYGHNSRDVDYLCRALTYGALTAVLALAPSERADRIREELAKRPPPTKRELVSAANATPLPDKAAPGGSKDRPERAGPRRGGFELGPGIEVIDMSAARRGEKM